KVGKNRLYDAFVIIAIEKEPPYMVGTYLMDEELIEYGREEYKELLELNKGYKKSGFYPPYKSGELETLYKPQWW
ncbi:MAG: PD-(D/E)XK nuclease-like domain-containing protein, partial [Candidatus Sabulitectum sp.]|nr:PD-(D/E)XK nuclease-like domain-containing protein [Candidatus Sabulitectum sp.]